MNSTVCLLCNVKGDYFSQPHTLKHYWAFKRIVCLNETQQTSDPKHKVKAYLYPQLAWVLLNVKAVKVLLNVMFYTLLRGVFQFTSASVPYDFYFCKRQLKEYISNVLWRELCDD